MKSFVIVSFFTKKTPYEQVLADYLGKSLTQYDIPYLCYAFDSLGSWRKNVTLKPHSILLAMQQCPNQNIVFLDGDATIESYPKLFEEIPLEYDLAAHYLDWNAWYGHTDKEPKKELLSGTMFFRNTEKVRKLVMQWYNDAINNFDIWEQKILQNILKKNESEYVIYPLPLEYAYIKTLPSGSEPKIKVEQPVIIHHQLSRKLKHLINPV